jgi:hypothetical protein
MAKLADVYGSVPWDPIQDVSAVTPAGARW